MRALAVARTPHGECVVDLCEGCHALWFDAFESVQLTPGAILALFREVTNAAAPVRRPLPTPLRCPRCRSTLQETRDVRHVTRFSYWRCTKGHGRFTPFVQFLREKDFVRPLSPAELERLKAHVKTIRCSGCGAPVALARDMACRYCGAPVEALDPAAIARALASLQVKEARGPGGAPEARIGAVPAGPFPGAPRLPDASGWPPAALVASGGDLIAAGLAALVDALDRRGT